MKVDVQIDEGRPTLARKMERLAKKTGVTVGFIAEDQMRLWVNDCIRLTPPKKLSDGRKSVAGGIATLFQPADNPVAFQVWHDATMQESDGEIYNISKRGKMRLSKRKLSDASVARMGRTHKQYRTKLGGVRKPSATRDAAWRGRYIVQRREYNRFVREKQQRVGWLKGGWGPAAEYYARRTHAPSKLPKWVKRHSQGSFHGRIDRNGNGFVAAINAVAYSQTRISEENFLAFTRRKRQRDITRGGMKRVTDLVERFNRGRAA